MKRKFRSALGLFLSALLVVCTVVSSAWAQAPRLVMASSVGPLAGKVAAPTRARLLLRLRAGEVPGAIRAAQDLALARLAGTSARLIERFEEKPALVIEAGLDALPALLGMGDLIEEIREEPGFAPAVERKTAAVKVSAR